MRKANRRLIFWIIFILALCLRLFYAFSASAPISGDGAAYDRMAYFLMHNHQYAMEEGRPTAFCTPFYAIFLAAIYSLFGHSLIAVKIAQAVLGLAVCVIIYFLAREIFSEAVAFIAFFLTGAHYFFISYGLLVLSENLFIFFVALTVLFLAKLIKKPLKIYAALFGLSASCATLTRSAFFLFPFFILGVLIIFRGGLPNQGRGILRRMVLAVAAFLIPVALWAGRNFFVFKKFIPLGTEAGIILYNNYNPPQGKILDVTVRDEVMAAAHRMPEAQGCDFLVKHTIGLIKKDPSRIYRYIPLRLMYFFSPFDWAAFAGPGVYNFSFAFIFPLALMGLAIIFKRYGAFLAALVISPVVYFIIIAALIIGVPRTRLPVEPYLIICAAFFIYRAVHKSRHKIFSVGVFVFWFALNFILYLNSAAVKAAARSALRAIGAW